MNNERWIPFQLAPDSDPDQRFIVTTEDSEDEVCGIVRDEATAVQIAALPDLVAACEAIKHGIETASFDRYAGAALVPAYRQVCAALEKSRMK